MDPAASDDAGLRLASAEVVALLLILARRSLAGVWSALVFVVRGTAETVLSEARVLRTGTDTLPISLPATAAGAAGDGPLAPLEVGVAATAGRALLVALAVAEVPVLVFAGRTEPFSLPAAGASTLLPVLAAVEDGLASLFSRS